MNAAFLVCFILCIAAGVAAAWSNRLDRADAAADYHIFHGPNSGCVDCEEK